jgi:2-hydroxy-3-keto-5-methylthiopentenyl-1-phosphate phosphatase
VTGLASKVAILCDFDGTVTVEEVSTSLLDEFSGHGWRKADADLLSGKISLRETMEREFRLLRASRKEMERFVGRVRLRNGFSELVAAAREHGYPLLVVSEGLDFYIAAFLKDKGLKVDFRTNHAVFSSDGIVVEHPFSDESCDRCGTCKKARLLQFKARGFTTVYVGDGISDRCPARFCDVLFARDGLLEYCRKESIRCFPYEDFIDVLGVLEGSLWERPRAGPGRPRRSSAPSGRRPKAPPPRPRPRRR